MDPKLMCGKQASGLELEARAPDAPSQLPDGLRAVEVYDEEGTKVT